MARASADFHLAGLRTALLSRPHRSSLQEDTQRVNMNHQASGSSSANRERDETPDGDNLQAVQKRRRLSTSLAGDLDLEADPRFRDEDSDGCQTPPRDSHTPTSSVSRSIINSEQVEHGAEVSSSSAGQQQSSDHALAKADGRIQERVARSFRGRSDSLSSLSCNSRSSGEAPESTGLSPPTTSSQSVSSVPSSNDCALSLPRFPKNTKGHGSPWPQDYHTAFIRYIAQDPVLKRFMAEDARDGSRASFKRFSELTNGPSADSIYLMAKKYRETHENLREGLTSAARRTRTDAWTDSSDLSRLEECESSSKGWLRTLHNELFVGLQSVAARTVTPSSDQVARRTNAARQATSSDPATTSAAATSGSRPARSVTRILPVRKQSSQNAASSAGPSKAAPSVTALGRQEASLTSPMDAQFAGPQEQMKQQSVQLEHQARQIALLQANSERQSELLAQQAELLQRQSQQAERQALQAERNSLQVERSAQQADRQSQEFARQTQTLDSVKQQLESLHALMRDRA